MKRFIQILCLMMCIPFSTVALAYKNNYWYVSADAGIFQADFNNTYLDQTDIIAQNITQTAEQHGYTGGVALGYRRLFRKNYFYGGEFSGNFEGHYASFQSGASTLAFSDKTQITGHFDLVFVPGMMLSDTIATYLKLGLSYALVKDSLNSPSGFTPTITTANNNRSAWGFAAGLGVEKVLTPHIGIFTEAGYHDYGGINFSKFQNFSATYSHSTHIYSYDVVVGVSYRMDA